MEKDGQNGKLRTIQLEPLSKLAVKNIVSIAKVQGYLKICPLTISWQQCDMLILKNVLIMIICVKVFCLSPVISINPVNSLAGVQHYMDFFYILIKL